MTVRIYTKPLLNRHGGQRCGERWPLYKAYLDGPDGEVVVRATLQPLLDGARALLARGITGPAELWGAEPYPHLSGDIEELAKLTVKETRTVGPMLRRYEAFPASGERSRSVKTPVRASTLGDGPQTTVPEPTRHKEAA